MKLNVQTALAAAIVAAAYALPALGKKDPPPLPPPPPPSPTTVSFSQTPGFYGGNTGGNFAAATQTTNGSGGLDFFFLVAPPTIAPAKGGPATNGGTLYQQIGWGCDATGGGLGCANAGVVGRGVVGPPGLFGNAGRSALRVTGVANGTLDANWNDVTIVEHQNIGIDAGSNVMTSVEVHSFLALNGFLVDIPNPDPSVTTVEFVETPNSGVGTCTLGPDIPFVDAQHPGDPHPGAPIDPLNSGCDDFALVSGLDLSPIPQLPPAIAPNTGVRFQIVPFNSASTLVCPGVNVPGGDITTQDSRCRNPVNTGTWYGGTDIIIYTAENNPTPNKFTIQAQLFDTTVAPVAQFVVGDVDKKGNKIDYSMGLPNNGLDVNFWGAQWWKNNFMSGVTSNGVASFKGYASNVAGSCGGVWQSRPGNSSNPPQTIGSTVAIIVTDTVLKQGPNISGTIKQILLVHSDGGYGPNPGHRGNGPVIQVLCTAP